MWKGLIYLMMAGASMCHFVHSTKPPWLLTFIGGWLIVIGYSVIGIAEIVHCRRLRSRLHGYRGARAHHRDKH